MKWLLVLAALTACTAAAMPCGNFTLSPRKGFKNVLIVGDSISMAPPYTPGGYGDVVRKHFESLSPPVYVQHAGGWYAGGQAANTVKGLICTNSSTESNYLNVTGTFDVVHFNYGLHDLVNCTDQSECNEHVDIATYAANLVKIAQRLQQIGKVVIFATTTPVPNVTTSLGRSYELAVRYNAAAKSALFSMNLPTDDLWSTMIEHCGQGYTACSLQLPRNVHLSPEGETVLGAAAVRAIAPHLGLGF
eukprot:m.247119 g.247119  ORF g.247119 m.247119 type:complete len:247 (+) comp15296_c0_seq1:14-754(+)